MSTTHRLAIFEQVSSSTAPFTLAARCRSVGYALRGVRTVVASQHNAWIHVAATLLVVGAGVWVRVSRFEWLALVFAIVSVWAAEALNTALELLCDAASPQFHPLIGRAKDVAAAAVLICALGAVVVGLLVFAPHLASAAQSAKARASSW
ncbi:MAG: diacylglycerol kinase family protein [Myxococcales bacterium]|nr:MAG: diacylglycerol kinase family protein [Myxococcales bacterium]